MQEQIHENMILAYLDATRTQESVAKDEGQGYDEEGIRKILSVSSRSIREYLKNIKDNLAEEQNKLIFDMWVACYTQEEIADKVGIAQNTVKDKLQELTVLEALPKQFKLSALYQDADGKRSYCVSVTL